MTVNGLEGRVVLSLTPTQAMSTAAQEIVQLAQVETRSQPQQLAGMINECESLQVLVPLMEQLEGTATFKATVPLLQIAEVDLSVAGELASLPGAKTSASIMAASNVSVENAVLLNAIIQQSYGTPAPSTPAPASGSSSQASGEATYMFGGKNEGWAVGASVEQLINSEASVASKYNVVAPGLVGYVMPPS